MILYMDIFIDDKPLAPGNVAANRELRHTCPQYWMPRKIDIAKYTLASYAVIPWTHVVIAFDAAREEDIASFYGYARGLFPYMGDISRPCSSNQTLYRAQVEKVCDLDDDFVFYATNNDHPLIASDISHLWKVIERARAFMTDYEFVSIVYSHLSEFLNAPIIGSPFYNQYARDSHIVSDDELATSFVRSNGDNSSIQIVNKGLLHHWFCSHDLGDARIIRAEDVRKFFLTPNQLMIVPKKELCAHFDGYSHTSNAVKITPDQVPPLFIPQGFFDRAIRIAYGYPECRPGWVNINPTAREFSFRDPKYGTDLKIGLQDIPLFWRDRISEIDINEDADPEELAKGRQAYYDTVRNPWRIK